MKKIVIAGLLGAAALLTTGCGGNACEDAADTIVSKLEECGVDVGDGDGDGEEVECTDELAKAAEALADCYEKASCDDIKSGAFAADC